MRKLLKAERHLEMNGKVITVPPHPPEFTSIPWNQLTVRIVGPSNGVISNVNISSAITSQLLLAANQVINYRLHSARFWGALIAPSSTAPLQSAAMHVFSLVPDINSGTTVASTRVPLEYIRDYPDQVRRAAVGFVWPLAQQSISIFGSAAPGFNILNIDSGGGANSLLYFRVWWRPSSA